MPDEKIRLLACAMCKTIEELPWYEGPADRDVLLEALVSTHGPAHARHIGTLFTVEKKQWDSPSVQEQIAKQISDKMGGGETGLGSEYYAVRNTYREDAMACWKQHQRNPGCNDYMTDAKRIQPGTKAERKAAGMPEFRSTSFLCHFCPVHSLVVTAKRKKAGMYDED